MKVQWFANTLPKMAGTHRKLTNLMRLGLKITPMIPNTTKLTEILL